MPQYDPCKYTYPSRRNVVYAKNGMACTSVPLGAQVGLGVLKAVSYTHLTLPMILLV